MKDIGKRILMKHKPTGEHHEGRIEDVNDEDYIVKLDESAAIFFECADRGRIVDPRYDNWEVAKVLG